MTEPTAASLKRAGAVLNELDWPIEFDDAQPAIARAIDEAVAPHVEALHGIRDDLENVMNSNLSPEIQLFATQILKGWRTQLDAIPDAPND